MRVVRMGRALGLLTLALLSHAPATTVVKTLSPKGFIRACGMQLVDELGRRFHFFGFNGGSTYLKWSYNHLYNGAYVSLPCDRQACRACRPPRSSLWH